MRSWRARGRASRIAHTPLWSLGLLFQPIVPARMFMAMWGREVIPPSRLNVRQPRAAFFFDLLNNL
jgi:hypothetical protein